MQNAFARLRFARLPRAVFPAGPSLANKGWDGIPLKSGDKYLFSIFAKLNSAGSAPRTLRARLTDGGGNIAAEGEIKVAQNSKLKVLPNSLTVLRIAKQL